MSSVVVELIGDELVSASTAGCSGQMVRVPDVQVLGIYFSAHWCPPCRMFTPQLAEFYRSFKNTESGASFEIIFVSSDEDETKFNEYHAEMPWLALPYTDRSRKEKLSKKFKVRGIPTFVLIDGQTGQLISDAGRENVIKHPDGEGFPWRPLPLSRLIDDGKLLNGSEEVDAKEALDGKIVGIYFSAHWCPPCRDFTPCLVETYNKLKAAGRNFEVIFVSSDNDEAGMKEYFSDMPWLAVLYTDESRRDQLSAHFDVSGIPTLVLIDEKRDLITLEGRSSVGRDLVGEKFPWFPEPFDELSDANGGALNDSLCFILLTENKEDLVTQAKSVLENIAPEYRDKFKASKGGLNPIPDIRFFYEGSESGDLIGRLKQFLSSNEERESAEVSDVPSAIDAKPRVWVIDITESRYYEVTWSSDESDPLSEGAEEKLRQLIADIEIEKIPYKLIG